MSTKRNHYNKLSRRDFLKLVGVGAGAVCLSSCKPVPTITPLPQNTLAPTSTPIPVPTATATPEDKTKVVFRIVFNVEYLTDPNLKPAQAGEFDKTKGLLGTLDTTQGYQTFTYTLADLKAQLGEGVTKLESLGILPEGGKFDSKNWVSFNGWPRDVNVLWVSNLSIGSVPLLTVAAERPFTFRNFYSHDDLGSPDYTFGTYNNNGIRNSTEGVDGGPCVKYIIAGTAGASFMVYKEPIDLSTLSDTDIFQISMKLGRNSYEKWTPSSVVLPSSATPPPTYEIGPGKQYENVGDMTWESLQAGDVVYIYWRKEAYKEKIGIDVQGTAEKPVIIHGVPGPDGKLPKIDGNHATTREAMPIPGQNRKLVSIGTAERPTRYVTIENLEICNANRTKLFYPKGKTELTTYPDFATGLHVEWGENITIRNCEIHHCGNGLFVTSYSNIIYYPDQNPLDTFYDFVSRDILIEGNYIYANGNAGRMTEHNSYCAAINTTYQFNRYGPLANYSTGYGLKDRGSGTVVRYNWIEGGRRQISIDDAQDSPWIAFDSKYIDAFVYGNILIEPDGGFRVWGDDEIISFGGDDENTLDRIGTLYFFNNTVVTYRTIKSYNEGNTLDWAKGRAPRTCLVFLPMRDQTADVKNNIFYRAGDAPLTMVNDNGIDRPAGTVLLSHNWFSDGWVGEMEGASIVKDDGTTLSGADPGFVDLAEKEFRLATNSPCPDKGIALEIPLDYEYVMHQQGEPRPDDGKIDIGAYEYKP